MRVLPVSGAKIVAIIPTSPDDPSVIFVLVAPAGLMGPLLSNIPAPGSNVVISRRSVEIALPLIVWFAPPAIIAHELLVADVTVSVLEVTLVAVEDAAAEMML